MATRTLICVDQDEAAVATIRAAAEPLGFFVQSIANGEQAIEAGRKNPPHLIIVCVEPRKVGYAICNKIKRSNELKDVPLILTSAEETLQTFEQHKKLKSRANEYVLKPLDKHELADKIGQLCPLTDPSNTSEEIILSTDSEEEISIIDSDIVEEQSKSGPIAAKAVAPSTAPPATPFGANPELESIFDKETDAAFAALQAPESDKVDRVGKVGRVGSVAGTAAPAPPSPWSSTEDGGWNTAEPTRASPSPPFDLPAAPVTPPSVVGIEPELAPSQTSESYIFPFDGGDVPPLPDEVSIEPAYSDTPPPLAAASPAPPPVPRRPSSEPGDDARVTQLEARLRDMEADRHRLASELEEAKTRLASQPLSKEKDLLSFREIINRKEKDLLDVRDALDARERQILDHKDRIREHERARRDLEEKSLGIEKTLMGANERLVALQQDKDKSIEREKGLKARLDSALTEIQKAHEEVDALKKRVGAVEERARADIDKLQEGFEGRLAEIEEGHRAETARLTDERTATAAAREREYEGELSRVTNSLTSELESDRKRAADELAAANDRASGEAARLRRDHDKALASAKEEQAVQLAAERQAHQAAIDAKERDHKNEILGLRRRHEEELVAAEERRQKELVEAEAGKVAELEAAEARRRSEIKARESEHQTQVAEMDRRGFEERSALSERHRGEIDQAHQRAARAEGDLAARTEELSEAYRKIAGHEADLDAARADLRDRDVRLAQARDRIAELEAKVAEYEDQVLKAFQKLRSDDKVIDKAKRALAVALTLLEERGVSPQQPATGVPQKPTSEESAT